MNRIFHDISPQDLTPTLSCRAPHVGVTWISEKCAGMHLAIKSLGAMNLAYDDCLMMDEELIHGQKNTLQNRPSMSRILVGTASASLSEVYTYLKHTLLSMIVGNNSVASSKSCLLMTLFGIVTRSK